MSDAALRLDDPGLAQDPLPAIEAFGEALAYFHQQPGVVSSRTDEDVAEARMTLRGLERGISPDTLPVPYNRIPGSLLGDRLEARPPLAHVPVFATHGSPTVSAVTVRQADGKSWTAHLSPSDVVGLDPAERDLSIAVRSVAETFAAEAVASFMIGFERVSERLPASALLDWYALVAALR